MLIIKFLCYLRLFLVEALWPKLYKVQIIFFGPMNKFHERKQSFGINEIVRISRIDDRVHFERDLLSGCN